MNEEIRLVPFLYSHIDQTHLWLQNEVLRQQIDSLGAPDREANQGYWQKKLKDKNFQAFAIEKNKIHIGNCGLSNIDESRCKAELWIYLGGNAKPRIGSTALRKLLEYGFQTKKLHKIYLRVVENNIRAQKLYEKFGFQKDGIARDDTLVGGQFINSILYSLLDREFEQYE